VAVVNARPIGAAISPPDAVDTGRLVTCRVLVYLFPGMSTLLPSGRSQPPANEHELAWLRVIARIADPVPRGFGGYLTADDDECVVRQYRSLLSAPKISWARIIRAWSWISATFGVPGPCLVRRSSVLRLDAREGKVPAIGAQPGPRLGGQHSPGAVRRWHAGAAPAGNTAAGDGWFGLARYPVTAARCAGWR
jgi:hypothetical protein